MKIIVVGLGSMGKRRIRLLKNNFAEHQVAGVDQSESRRLETREKFSVQVFSDLLEGISEFQPEAALICTPPLLHGRLANICLEHGLHVFTELNLVDDLYDVNLKIAEKKGLTLFLSSTALYRREIQFLRNAVEGYRGKLFYNYHVGQYLPMWHPWENYKDFFVGNKRTNGCREFLAINLPWILKTFGTVKDFHVIKSKVTDLEIEYEDCYIINLVHENGTVGSITVDVVSREPVFSIYVAGENFLVTWDGKVNTIKQLDVASNTWKDAELYPTVDKLVDYNSNIIENAYTDEIDTFLGVIAKRKVPLYSFEDDYETIKLMDAIEGA